MNAGQFISECAREGFRPPHIEPVLLAQIGLNPTESQGSHNGNGPIISKSFVLHYDDIISEARINLLPVIHAMHRSVLIQRAWVVGWKCRFSNPVDAGLPDDPSEHYFCEFSMITDQPDDVPDMPDPPWEILARGGF